MKRILLHVGLPKTGTTSIQNLLAGASADLESDGVLFPIVHEERRIAGRAEGVGIGWHRSLASYVGGRADRLAPGEWEAWRAEFCRFDRSPAMTTLVLSQEGLIVAGKPQGIADLLAELPTGARRVVIVLRPAHAWLTSLYEQFVRSVLRTADLPHAFDRALGYVERGYEGMLRRTEQMVPGASFQLLSFDDLVAGPGLLANFTRALDLPPWLAERAAAMPRANPGLPQDMVAFLRAANAAAVPMPRFVAIRAALARAARRRTGRRERAQIFPPDLAQRIAERYAADRTFVQARYGLDLPAAPPPAAYTPLACDPPALRVECAPWLAGEDLTAFDAVARTLVGGGREPR